MIKKWTSINNLFIIAAFMIVNLIPVKSNAGSWNGWIYQDPYPTSANLFDVKFVTPSKGWITGKYGTILYTEDGGENWEAQESGTEEDLIRVYFVNEKIGWAAGKNGSILHTENGGKTWLSQVGTSTTLNNVFFINDKDGWAVGDQGTVLHTTNGGHKWEKREIEINRAIASIYFVSPHIGWILAGDEVYRTQDGGKNWEKSKIPIDMTKTDKANGSRIVSMMKEDFPREWAQGDIYFSDAKNGWAVLGYWLILATTDGGKTWENRNTTGYMSYGLRSISFADEKRGCAVGSSIVCTEDGGKTWVERLGIKPGSSKRIDGFLVSIKAVTFVNQKDGWTVGSDGQLMKTEDSGKTWKMAARRDECGDNLFFVNKKTGWFYGKNDYVTNICRTDDGGQSRLKQEVGIKVWSLFFTDASTGWAVGVLKEEDGVQMPGGPYSGNVWAVIKKTSDGGQTWSIQFKELVSNDLFDNALFKVFFLNPREGWSVGNKGYILHTTDSGMHWEHRKSGDPQFFLRTIFFNDSEIGWATGARVSDGWTGIILSTKDSGQHWRVQHKKQNAWFNSIFIAGQQTAWVIGNPEYSDYCYLLKTEDGGKTWTEKGFDNIGRSEISFIDRNRGVISSDKGWIVITNDSGKTWTKKRMPLSKVPWHFSKIFEAK